MSDTRFTSLDPVSLKNWRWAPFLQESIRAISVLQLEEAQIPLTFLDKTATFGSKSKSQQVQINTWACRSTKLRYARAVCVEAGRAASVLNFLVNPFHKYDLPFFGADLVSLPAGHLVALDLQPVLKLDKLHTAKVWERIIPLHKRWQCLMPWGGPIPKEAEPYFSPGFLWARLPLGDEGDQLISNVLLPAYKEYFSLYLDLVQEADEVSLSRSSNLLEGQKTYMRFRAEKDPARGMLTRFCGREWTESYIKNFLFDL